MAELLTPLRNYLVAENVVRDPRTASGLPPLWVAPKQQNAPGEAKNPVEMHPDLVVAVFRSPGVPPDPREGWIRRDGVQFVLRARTALYAYQFESQLRTVLNDREHFTMDTLLVEQALITSDLAQLGLTDDNSVFDFTVNYLLTTFQGP